MCYCCLYLLGPREDCGGPGQIQKVGPILCEGGGGGGGGVEILHALKCVLGASEVPFCTCIQYIPTGLPVAVFV